MKRTPLKPRSRKREKLYAEQRRPIVTQLLDENPVCAKCQKQPATDVHEIKTRARGGSITDRSNLVCLCRLCHMWVTENPIEAQKEGWVKWSWED